MTKVGSGTVSSTPAGISCGATCTASYASGQQVTLQATPTPGSIFAGWSGACTGTGACTVTMNAGTAVTATFTPTFALTVSKAGTGTGTVSSTPAGISCGASCAASYASGQQVTLQASADAGSIFSGLERRVHGDRGVHGDDDCGHVGDGHVHADVRADGEQGGDGHGHGEQHAGGDQLRRELCGELRERPAGDVTGQRRRRVHLRGLERRVHGRWRLHGHDEQAIKVTATFNAAYSLTVSVSGTGTGSVTSSPAGVSCGSTCSASYRERPEGHPQCQYGSGLEIHGLDRSVLGDSQVHGHHERSSIGGRHLLAEVEGTVSAGCPVATGAPHSPRNVSGMSVAASVWPRNTRKL